MASPPISPVEPTRKHPLVQPNAHPYAIKTTSSALLSRSNTSPHSPHYNRHHYVPSLPACIPTRTRMRHCHSSSLSLIEGEVRTNNVNGVHTIPAPLPTPPSMVRASPDNLLVSLKCAKGKKLHRSQTITEHRTYDRKQKNNHNQGSRAELYAALPPNPKQWNTDQLATYLETYLGSGNLGSGNNTDGNNHDSSLMDIVECVRTRGLTGRELLRLTDTDLAEMPLSDVQRTKLLERSRALRSSILRGRIYVDSYHSHEIFDNSNDIYSRSARSSSPFHSIRGASASADDLHLLLDNDIGQSETLLTSSPPSSLHRSNSDASAQRYRDLARMRLRRRGRVKGLVETWERASMSGSEGSMSGSDVDSESEIDRDSESVSDTKHSPVSSSDPLSASPDEQIDVPSPMLESMVPEELPLLTPPPSYTHIDTILGASGDDEEPSIEELLGTSLDVPLTGARAWEADFGLGETMKRIPDPAGADPNPDSVPPLIEEPDMSRPRDDGQQTRIGYVRSKGSVAWRSTGSGEKHAKTRQRVVTAIFTGSRSDDAPGTDHGTRLGHPRKGSGMGDPVRGELPTSPVLQTDPDCTLRVLEKSITETRAQVEAFRVRLEVVEADTAKQEAMLMEAQSSDFRYSPAFELKRRQSKTIEQSTTEEREPPNDETIIDRARNGDIVEHLETMSLADITRVVIARAIGWLFPYGHLTIRAPDDCDGSRTRTGSLEASDTQPSTKKSGRFPMARMSCSIILVSFALCASVLRRVGFGRWIRGP